MGLYLDNRSKENIKMKLGFCVLGLVAAGKGGKGGKHGALNIGGEGEGDRFLWQTPLCLQGRDCTTKVQKGTSGSIVFDEELYNKNTNYIFKIQTAANRKIKMKFDKSVGFDLEWHNKCGFDKVHIYSGNEDDNKRFARLCGPKAGTSYPHDATGNLKFWKKTGKMAMWDWAVPVAIGDAFVAVDIDQSFQHKGFKLDWTTEVINMPNFSNVWTAYTTSMWNRMIRDIDSNKKKICTKNIYKVGVPSALQSPLKNQFESGVKSLDDAQSLIDYLTDIVHFYLGDCKVKNAKTWTNKANTMKDKLLLNQSNGGNNNNNNNNN